MTPSPIVGRLFIAVPLSDDVRRRLVDHLHRALGAHDLPGRVVVPPNWHLTLRFLGDTPRDVLDRLCAELAATDLGPPFELTFTVLGAFPSAVRARVLWVGTGTGAAELTALAAHTERAAATAGLSPDGRPFAAHLTLSRLKPDANVRALLAAVPPFGARQTVDQVVLFRSHLGRDGARYEALTRFPLRPLFRTS